MSAIDQPPKDRGVCLDRTQIQDDTGRLERSLSDLWVKENEERPGVNYGYGILQDLFFSRGLMLSARMIHEVTDTERMVAATVIQWLGTNCGRCFLFEAYRKAGWKIHVIPPATDPKPKEGAA